MRATPGPWRIATTKEMDNGCVVETLSKRMICECYEDGEQTDEDRANAQLIAGAPAMFFVLRDAELVIRGLAEAARNPKDQAILIAIADSCRAAIAGIES